MGIYAPGDCIKDIKNGFILHQEGSEDNPHLLGDFAVFSPQADVVVDHCWFRGGWWDPLTMAWKNIENANLNG